ncbi:cysteine protease [Brevundimonas sp. Marseille-Q4549]
MSRLHKLVPMLGGLLLSKGGRRLAGRHAGKLALATLAYEVWRSRRERGRAGAATPPPPPRPQRQARWSGRTPR